MKKAVAGKRRKLPNYSITQFPNSQRGYLLITMMLFVALLSIAALAVIPQIKQQIKRDREEELMHRGTAYMRAIQHFYKKNGRYPTRIEDLENTNNIRYLRKRYKDPMNRDPETHKEKDFKLLHMSDINLLTGQALGGPGLGLNPGTVPGPGTPGGNPFGGPQQNLLNRQAGGSNQSGNVGANQADAGDQGDSGDNGGAGNTGNLPKAGPNQGTGAVGGGPLQAVAAGGNNPLTFGGGPILGVASTNKDRSIREFGDKYKHYNEWLFIYDPTADRGGLLKGPVVPESGGRGGIGGSPLNPNQGNPPGNPPFKPGPGMQPPQNPPNAPEEP